MLPALIMIDTVVTLNCEKRREPRVSGKMECRVDKLGERALSKEQDGGLV